MISQTEQINITRILEGRELLEKIPPRGVNLFSGKLGRILFLAYTYKLLGEEEDLVKTLGYIDDIFDYLNEPTSHGEIPWVLPSLCAVLAVLKQDGIVEIELEEDNLAAFDELIFTHSKTFIRNRNIDFLYGLAGSICYLSRRVDINPLVKGYLEILFSELMRFKIADEKGTRFFNAHISKMNNSNDVDFGIAHGQCGLLLAWLKVYERGVLRKEIKDLVNSGINYIEHHRKELDYSRGIFSYFPVSINENFDTGHRENKERHTNRLGWCYGDLNVALLYYRASSLLGLKDLAIWANEIGSAAANRRTLETSGVEEGHFCHGAAGLVSFFSTLFAEQPLPVYADAKMFWLTKLEGYHQGQFDAPDTSKFGDLLMGASGSLLVLLSEALNNKTSWEELFLVK